MTRTMSFAFGLLMVAASAVRSDGSALAASAVAGAAVIVGLRFRVAATGAVAATVATLALADPPPVLAAVAGLAAAAYLVLRHAGGGEAQTALTAPTVLAASGLSAVAVLGTAIPLGLPWVPLVAPLAVVAIYAVVVNQFVT